MSLGVMHSSGDAEIAVAIVEAAQATNQTAINSLKNNEMDVTALHEANKVQAKATAASIMKTADNYGQEALGSILSASSTIASYGLTVAFPTAKEAPSLASAEREQKIVSSYDTKLKEAQKQPSNPVIQMKRQGRVLELAAKKNNSQGDIDSLKSKGFDFTNAVDHDANIKDYVAAMEVADKDEQEKILENLAEAKKAADQKVNSFTSRQQERMQKAGIFTNLMTSSVTAYQKFQQQNIEKLRAAIEKTKTLMDFVTSVYQQLMQISLGIVNQQEDRAKALHDAENQVAAANRAV